MRILLHSGFDRWGSVGAQVVENYVYALPSRLRTLDRAQELQGLLRILTGSHRAGDLSGQDIEGRVQTRVAIRFVVMGPVAHMPG